MILHFLFFFISLGTVTHIQTAKSQLRCHLIITNFTLPASPMFKWANQSKTRVPAHTPPSLVMWIYPANSSARTCRGSRMRSGSAPCSAAAPWHVAEQNLTSLHAPQRTLGSCLRPPFALHSTKRSWGALCRWSWTHRLPSCSVLHNTRSTSSVPADIFVSINSFHVKTICRTRPTPANFSKYKNWKMECVSTRRFQVTCLNWDWIQTILTWEAFPFYDLLS